jgi:hypothetical protein
MLSPTTPPTKIQQGAQTSTDIPSALVAEVDEDKDASLDYGEIMAAPLNEVRY